MSKLHEHGLVVVYRSGDPYPVRHIIGLGKPYDQTRVKRWYHTRYHKFDDDIFVHCEDMEKVNELIAKLKEGITNAKN